MTAAVIAAIILLDCLEKQQGAGRGAGSSSSSNSTTNSSSSSSTVKRRDAALAVLAAEETVPCVCLNAVMPMLVQYVQQAATGSDAPTACTSTSSSSSNSSRGAPVANHQQPAAVEQWLSGALAAGMPAAYSSMLEQLGVSREVGLWLAMLGTPMDAAGAPCNTGQEPAWGLAPLSSNSPEIPEWLDSLCYAIWQALTYQYALVMGFLDTPSNKGHPQLAPLHVSMAAIYLQWLSSMPQHTTLQWISGCKVVCEMAGGASQAGRRQMRQQQPLQPDQQQPPDSLARFDAAHQMVVQLSAAVLSKLLKCCRGLPDSSTEHQDRQ